MLEAQKKRKPYKGDGCENCGEGRLLHAKDRPSSTRKQQKKEPFQKNISTHAR